jgi:predicted nucleotidyltransferase
MLDVRLTEAQEAATSRIVASTADGGHLDFLVVYGSVSRGQQHAGSDLDIYYETSDQTSEPEAADPDSRWHVFGVPAGALLDNLRRGDQFAFDLVTDALVVVDDGPFRELVVAVDEEQLKPAERLDPPPAAPA